MENFHKAEEEQSHSSSCHSSDTANLLQESFISQNIHLVNTKEGSLSFITLIRLLILMWNIQLEKNIT